jgi:hypothetical protein
MYRTLHILAFVVLISACSSPEDEGVDNGIEFNIDLTETVLKTAKGNNFYDRVERAHFIPLETKQECLIGSVLQMRIVGDKILILNGANSDVHVLIFDKRGNFIRKVGRKGKGPGEYADAFDFDIEPGSNNLTILSPSEKKLMQYSLEGEFVQKIDLKLDILNVFPARLSISHEGNFITTCEGRDCDLASFDSLGNILQHSFPTSKGFTPNLFSLTKFKQRILYNNCQNDTIYQVQSGKPLPYLYADFGPNSYNSSSRYNEYFSKHIVLESDNYIYMTFSMKDESYSFLLKKATSHYDVFEWKKKGFLGYSYPRITGVSSSGEFISLQFASYIFEEYNELMKSPPPGFTFETAISSKLDVEDNPVIMLMSLR